jgi:hypothetical protein
VAGDRLNSDNLLVLLSKADLGRMRSLQLARCAGCNAALERDYCREHDEFFDRGHRDDCRDCSPHEAHRSYRDFDATVESGLGELADAYRREAGARR